MIFGIGIDLCDAGRLEKSLAKQSFLDHVFAPSEQALLASLGESDAPRPPPQILRPRKPS